MANENLIPQIRFPEFSGNWEIKEFGNLYDFKTTNSFSRDNLNYENGSVKNIHYGDIHTKFNAQFDITKELVPFINEDIDVSKINDESYLIEGDLVIADASEDYADIGKAIEIINLNDEKTVAGLHTLLARRKSEDIAIGFASFVLKTNRVRLAVMKIAQGSKVLSISANRFAKIDLHLPNLPEEQTKIANFIAKIDKQIQLLEKEKTLLEKYKKAISKKIFNQEIRFNDDNGNDFPDWEEKVLGDIFEYKNGKSFEQEVCENGTYNLITLNSIDIDGKLKSEHKTVNINDNSLNKNDLIMILSDVAHGYFLGLTAIVPENDKYVLNQRVGALKPVEEFDVYFVSKYINISQKYFKLKGQGSSQQNLSKGDILKFKIYLPNIKEQIKISNFIESLYLSIDKLDVKIHNTKYFKKSLLQKMFV